MAQRLVRLVCPACKVPHVPEPSEIPPGVDLEGARIFRSEGCRECRNTGFSGRIGIYELMVMNEQTRELVMSRANARQIAQAARAAGDLTWLRDAGFEKVRSGQTTIPEVLRATKV